MTARRDYWNDIPRDVLGKFCSTMRGLGFDTKEFIDDDGYWKITKYGEYTPKVISDFEIKRLRSRANFENDVFKHAQKLWQERLHRGINAEKKRFFNVSEVNALGLEYLEKYIDYDLHSWAKVIDTKKNWLARKLFNGYFATDVCFLYFDWSKTRRACVARLFRKAFASVVLAHIEVSQRLSEEDCAYIEKLPFGFPDDVVPNGEFIEDFMSGGVMFNRHDPFPKGILPDIKPFCQYRDENMCSSIRYRVSDITPRCIIKVDIDVEKYGAESWKDDYIPNSPLEVYNF